MTSLTPAERQSGPVGAGVTTAPGLRSAGRRAASLPIRSHATGQLQAVVTTAVLSIGSCLLVGLYASSSRPDTTDRLLLCIVLMVPAVLLALAGSTLLLDYLLLIVAVNREFRRLLDWGQGQYDPTPLLSLLPLLTTALMVLTVVGHWRRLSPTMRRAAGYLLGAMAYGFALGFAGYGFPSIYACAEYATPLVVLFYCVSMNPSANVVRRWVTVLGTLGVILGVYGIYQWIDPPPWDAAWVIWSTMYSSMGSPTPYALSICSTLESRGPAAMFFAVTTAALISLPALRRGGGVLLAAIPAAALLLTQARTGLIYLVLTLLAAAVFARRGGGSLKILLALTTLGAVTFGVLGRQEQSNIIFDRVATLGHVEDDGSANGRVSIASEGLITVLSHPLGFGFGSGGNAIKAAANPGESDAVGDNGYLEILSTLGVPGTLLYGLGFWLIVRTAIANRFGATWKEANTYLGMGLLVALAPALVIANQLTTAHASYIWILLSRHLAAQTDPSRKLRTAGR